MLLRLRTPYTGYKVVSMVREETEVWSAHVAVNKPNQINTWHIPRPTEPGTWYGQRTKATSDTCYDQRESNRHLAHVAANKANQHT